MKKTLLLSLMAMILFTACKKEREISLKGKWNVETIITKEYQGGTLTNTNTEPGNGYKYDFQDDGNLLITAFLVGTSAPYIIMADSKVEIDSDIFEIRDLTALSVTLFIRQDFGSGDYHDMFVNLKR
jgi:copper(I)-binding protein